MLVAWRVINRCIISELQSTVMAIMARLVRPGLHVPLLAVPGQSHVCSGAKLFPVMLLKGARDGSNKMCFFGGNRAEDH